MPIKHDRDAIAHAHGFFLIVCHENKGDAESTLQQLEFDLHFFAQFAVKRTKRFIEQQHAGSVHEGASNCDTLLLTTRHLTRLTLGQFAHLHHVEGFGDFYRDL